MGTGVSIVGDHRHDDPGIASLINDILHVIGVWEGHAFTAGVLVLGLVQNDGAAVGDLMLGDNLADIGDIADSC
jgi:hypothetical protein